MAITYLADVQKFLAKFIREKIKSFHLFLCFYYEENQPFYSRIFYVF